MIRIHLLLSGLLVTTLARGAEPGAEFFEHRIRPVLVRHCYECHSAASAEIKGGLRLDSRDGLRQGGETGPAVVPGDVGSSLLISALRHESLEMPPGKKLPDPVIADFTRWIETGASDPRDEPASATAADRAWRELFEERRIWWSLQPVRDPPLPPAASERSPREPLDYFVAAKLATEGLRPAPPADRPTLIRRLSFALLGVPPEPDEVATFVADSSPTAYEALVDRMLASPQFGERWARHWMDVIRYSDTYGYEWDIPAKGSWRFRDYLIRALNQDVPFDQWVREQIAGDLLESPRIDPVEQINESLAGVMFFQLGEKRHGDSAEFDGIHQEMLDNKIDAFSKAFQGTTVACARCHDHKLDPIAQREYYALAGVFMSSRWVVRTLDTPQRNATRIQALQDLKQKLRPLLAADWAVQVEGLPAALLARTTLAAPGEEAPKDASKEEPATLVARVQRVLASATSAPPQLEDPIYPWFRMTQAAAAGMDLAAEWRRLAEEYSSARQARTAANARDFVLVADFRQAAPVGWSIDGVGLRERIECGDFTIHLEGPAAVGRVLPGGYFTHAISPRFNGAVRTPWLNQFEHAFLSFEHTGGDFAAHRTIVDNAFLTERQVYLKQPGLGWLTLSTFPTARDRKIYIELATKGSNPNFPPRVGLGGACTEEQARDPRSWFGLTRVFAHNTPASPADELARFEQLFHSGSEDGAPRDLSAVADRYRRWLQTAVSRWGEQAADENDVQLIHWMLDRELILSRWDQPGQPEIAAFVTAYRDLEKQLDEPQTTHGMADLDPGADYRLNVRGDYDQLGEAVPRGYLEILAGTASRFASPGSGRLELAEQIARSDNPLTARVFVNRVWQWLFGTGIVATPDDFGHLSDPPSHPELLDHVASRFMQVDPSARRDDHGGSNDHVGSGDHGSSESARGVGTDGWSLKRLIRAIVTSDTWRQSGDASSAALAIDPHNRWLHHYPLRRLEAEPIRDAILAVSGRLDRSLYGPPLDPVRPNEDPQKRLFSGPADGLGRRSIYTKITIMEPPRLLATFNQPEPKIPTGRRDVTNTPAQSLALLNDPFVRQQADVWARELLAGGHASCEDRLRELFRRALGRDPADDERARWLEAVAQFAAAHGVSTEETLTSLPVWQSIAHAMFNTKEFIYVR